MVKAFVANQSGATAIEYALIASMISIAILTALLSFQGETGNMYANVFEQVSAALSGEE